MLNRVIPLVLILTVIGQVSMAEQRQPFEFRDGDRVVLLGGTMIERAQKYGALEASMTAAFPNRQVSFRNLGWSGDTVFAESRGIFDPPAVGYQRMTKQIAELKPTLIFVGYGTNESFAGASGLNRFTTQLNKLLNDLEKTKATIVLVSPHRHERMKSPLPDASKNNANLGLYTKAIQAIAQDHEYGFVDLYNTVVAADSKHSLTYNGIHFAKAGYQQMGRAWADELGLVQPSAETIIVGNIVQKAGSASATNLKTDGQTLSFDLKLNKLPSNGDWPKVRIDGLKSGKYTVAVGDQKVAELTAKQLQTTGFNTGDGPDGKQLADLREKIIDKNLLYFHRWRPQNVTYLFGFRKHEQGNNAKEVAEFEPLVKKVEDVIAKLRQPIIHRFTISPAK